jgi:4'-phosphopantetheinyl transferase
MKTLSADELLKAERFYFEKDRHRFIVGRGLLRIILGQYLKTEPNCLRFSYNPYGKPELVAAREDCNYNFSLSHSHGLLLIAIARGREIGVDLERLSTGLAGRHIAERFFSPGELATICSYPAEQREEVFLRYWTRKEAYVKAMGQGLAMLMDQFEVSLSANELCFLNTDGSGKTFSCSLAELHPGPGYFAALAVQGRDFRLKCFQRIEEDSSSGRLN